MVWMLKSVTTLRYIQYVTYHICVYARKCLPPFGSWGRSKRRFLMSLINDLRSANWNTVHCLRLIGFSHAWGTGSRVALRKHLSKFQPMFHWAGSLTGLLSHFWFILVISFISGSSSLDSSTFCNIRCSCFCIRCPGIPYTRDSGQQVSRYNGRSHRNRENEN